MNFYFDSSSESIGSCGNRAASDT